MMRKSIGGYPNNWPEIAKGVKDEAHWRCVRCGHLHNALKGYCLTVHHLDLNPANCEWWNTPALCQRCHLQIQAKVIMERPWIFEHSGWFRPYAAGYYASINGHSTDKEWVIEHLEFLLDLTNQQGSNKAAVKRG